MPDSSCQKHRPNTTSKKTPGGEDQNVRGGMTRDQNVWGGVARGHNQCAGRGGERRECVRRGDEISVVVAQNGVAGLVTMIDDVQGVHLRDTNAHFKFFFV